MMTTSQRVGSTEASMFSHGVSFGEAVRTWARVAALSFGGPTGQIAVMHRIIVEEKHWISEERFLHALNYCMLLPGPEAQQLAVYIGWLMHRTRGGLMAGGLFILPGFVALMVLSILYAHYGDVPAITAVFFGLKPAVIAIVAEAVVRIGKRVLKNGAMLTIALLSFVAVFFFNAPFPLVVLVAALVGFVGHRIAPTTFNVVKGHGAKHVDEAPPRMPDGIELPHMRPSLARLATVVAVGAALWFGPLALLAWQLSPQHVLVKEGVYFSKAAMVTFGGAYAVLDYVRLDAVEEYQWLEPDEMLVGLGLAETTPGPLILVLQFVGFMGGYNRGPIDSPGMSPLAGGIAGACITVWTTFVPCFIWILAGAPYIERVRSVKALSATLSSITAAVVGCVFNLALWFAMHVVFVTVETRERQLFSGSGLSLRWLQPRLETLQLDALLIAAFAGIMLFVLKRGMLPTLAGSVALGAALWALK
jgi:chromate transporter